MATSKYMTWSYGCMSTTSASKYVTQALHCDACSTWVQLSQDCPFPWLAFQTKGPAAPAMMEIKKMNTKTTTRNRT